MENRRPETVAGAVAKAVVFRKNKKKMSDLELSNVLAITCQEGVEAQIFVQMDPVTVSMTQPYQVHELPVSRPPTGNA